MMMAQTFPAHQGIPQHPGLPPGHPMAPGQHPNAHPGAGMVQQMHPGVSAPGGPQVSQGGPVMGGMPPGAGTTGPGSAAQAHALSHLGPAQAHMFQQPHFAQQFANNPQLLQQHQQQQYLRQRMMLQHQQQQQQQQHGGLPVQLPNGAPALNAAQIAAMQANPAMRPVNLQMQLQQMPHGQPQNLQQQQQFFAMQQAQQQAHQAQIQQAAAAGQPGQQTPQQRAAAQPQNVHDAQSVTPQPQPGPPPHQGSATPQPNPPPVPTSQPPQQQPAAPQPQPTPNPPPQQLPQAQQPGQQPQAPQAAQAQPQPQPNQQGPQQGQQQPPMTAQEAQIKAQQQQNPTAMMMQQQQQQQRMNMKGAAILQLNSFAESLSYISGTENASTDYNQWHNFVLRFYSPGGVLRHTVCNPQANSSKQFEIATPALARYYLTQCTSGIKHIQMLVDGARERDSPNGGHIVESAKTAFIYWFANGSQLFARANMTAHFDMNNKIEMLDIAVLDHNEYLPRSQLQALELADQQKQSPKVSKNMGKRAQAKQAQQPAFTLPESMVTPNGVPTAVMSFLEVAETISHMQVLFQFSQQNPHLTPSEALRTLVNTMQAPPPNAAYTQGPMNPALQQGQPRAPSMSMPNQFASPAMTHLGLPGAQGSPHLTGSAHPSPAQSHLAGPPGMVPQGQVQGNMAQGTSASASPNVGNKRRRASTVKMENDDNGGEVNGTAGQAAPKVKASPRVGAKKQKGGG
ncbi:hypothetical protein BO79DRAFT_41398 [Aspergillus costaricaensis CBS 115574]|nr:hypothetical protein BO79DRAFT_41398 [Aspergillus costaricaensis CBS 115574]RAK85870.1 hypothetical protein BO79DRAFT_41398 [Aspergillus costaricaensis CBS 115574]